MRPSALRPPHSSPRRARAGGRGAPAARCLALHPGRAGGSRLAPPLLRPHRPPAPTVGSFPPACACHGTKFRVQGLWPEIKLEYLRLLLPFVSNKLWPRRRERGLAGAPFINHGLISVEAAAGRRGPPLSRVGRAARCGPGGGRRPDPALLAVAGAGLVRYNLPGAACVLAACLRCQVLGERESLSTGRCRALAGAPPSFLPASPGPLL